MTPGSSDRRRVQRVHLSPPLTGKIRTQPLHVMDVSLRGVRVAHAAAIGRIGDAVVVRFEWDGRWVELECEITRTELQRIGRASYSHTLYHSGLAVRQSAVQSRAALREIIEAHVVRALEEQKANSRGKTHSPEGHEELTTELVRHELNGGRWTISPTAELHQPPNGFTIAAEHTRAEVQMLRKAFENGTADARAEIRRLAEVSIREADRVRLRRYQP